MLAAAPRKLAEPGAAAPVPVPDEGKSPTGADGVDEDVARRLYRHLPLAELAALIGRPDFPAALRTPHLEVVFTRALLLEDWAIADKLASQVAAPRQTTQPLYRRYLAAAKPADKKLAAALILANTPELNPMPIGDSGAIDYWGCHGDSGTTGEAGVDPLLGAPALFLSDGAQAAAARERRSLEALPIRTRWLAEALLAWAATKPDEAEAPKALHFLVASTRMECLGSERKTSAPNHSRRAFELLHSLWPRSEWAAKTKYWF